MYEVLYFRYEQVQGLSFSRQALQTGNPTAVASRKIDTNMLVSIAYLLLLCCCFCKSTAKHSFRVEKSHNDPDAGGWW